jgi:predicted metal-dependent hydrolase
LLKNKGVKMRRLSMKKIKEKLQMKKIIKLSLIASILAVVLNLNASSDVRQRNAGYIEKQYNLVNRAKGNKFQLNRIELKLNIIIKEIIKKERKEEARKRMIKETKDNIKNKADKLQNWIKEKVK